MDCVLDIVRESSGMLCSSLPMLLLITLVLIFPVSSITLSQVMTNRHLAGQLSAYLSRRLVQAGVLHLTPITSLFYMQLSETLVFQALCFPVILTLFLLAKVAIFYILSCQQRGNEASVMGFLEEGPRAWSRVAATYLWGCALVLLLTGMVVLLNIAGSLISNLIRPDGFDCWVCLVLESGSAVALTLVLAPLVIVMNLGSVVAGMEERRSGGRAFVRALTLLKHRKLQPALLLFLVTGLGIIVMECAFQYRVLGRGSVDEDAAASMSFVEAPFLVFAHSFLLLFDIVMSFAFYHACALGANSVTYTSPTEKQDGDGEDDYFSICVHVLEQQCRKILSSSTTELM